MLYPAGNLIRTAGRCLKLPLKVKQFTPLQFSTSYSTFEQKRNFATKQKDYYNVLGISTTAKEAEIKSAYLKLAKKFHPDVCKDKDAGPKFQEISEAYEVLGDKQKRQEYDAYQRGGFQQGFDSRGTGAPGAGGWNFHSTKSAEDIFRDFFGGQGRDFAESQHGFNASQQISVRVSFEEAARGVQKTVTVNAIDDCGLCQGSGVKIGRTKVSCPYCNGTGVVTKQLSGFFMQSTCTRCQGQGVYNKDPCMDCEGHGKLVQARSVGIYIPPGVDNNEMLRMQVGQSLVYVNVQVKPSLIHKRIKENIYTDVEISLSDAVLGGVVKVPGIEGDSTVRIPPGTSSHAQMCLKGKGIKRLNDIGTGDQYINVKINIPKSLNAKQRELIQEWSRIERGESVASQSASKSSSESASAEKSNKASASTTSAPKPQKAKETVKEEKSVKEEQPGKEKEDVAGSSNS